MSFTDLALDSSGDIPAQPYLIRDHDAVLQRLRIRFRFFQGEYFLDLRLGVPYRSLIFVKNPDSILISFIFRSVLVSTPGIERVDSFNAVLDKTSRMLTVSFKATLSNEQTISTAAEPFILG